MCVCVCVRGGVWTSLSLFNNSIRQVSIQSDRKQAQRQAACPGSHRKASRVIRSCSELSLRAKPKLFYSLSWAVSMEGTCLEQSGEAMSHMILVVSSKLGFWSYHRWAGRWRQGLEQTKERRKSPCSMLPEWQLEVAAPSRMYCDRLKILRVSHVHKYAVQILHIKYVAEPGIRSMAAMTVKTL